MKGLWVQKVQGYSKRQFSFLSGKKMTALLTRIKLQIFKRLKKKNFWTTHWTHCRKLGVSWALPLQNQMPNVLTVPRDIGHHFRKEQCLSHSKNHQRGWTYTLSWMDDRMGNPLTFPKQEYFLKIFQTGPFLSSSTVSTGVSAILTPHLENCNHFPNCFPCPWTHSPQMCSPHTPESELKRKSISSSAKNLSTVPCCHLQSHVSQP